MHKRDNIFNYEQTVADFAFDERTVSVFPDMIHRSIPAYASLVQMSSLIAADIFSQKQGLVYDLGCSLGAVSLAFSRLCPEARIIAVDKSPAMVNKFAEFLKLENNQQINLIEADILELELQQASVVFLNFVLQFINLEQREKLLKTIFNNLAEGGVLILAEKTFNNQELKTWHENFKRYQGYSDLEIAQKREALENVMKTEEIKTIENRLKNIGFSKIIPFYQAFSFKAWAVIK